MCLNYTVTKTQNSVTTSYWLKSLGLKLRNIWLRGPIFVLPPSREKKVLGLSEESVNLT